MPPTKPQPKQDKPKVSATPKGKKRCYDENIAIGDKCLIHGKYRRGGKSFPVPIIITHVAENYVTYKPLDGSTFSGRKFSHCVEFREDDDDVYIIITEKKPVPPPPAPIIKKEVIENVIKQEVIKEVHHEHQVYLPQFEETAIDRWYKKYCLSKGRMLDKKVYRETKIYDAKTNELIEVIDNDRDI